MNTTNHYEYRDNKWNEDSCFGGVQYYPDTNAIKQMNGVNDFIKFLSDSIRNKKIDICFNSRFQTDICAYTSDPFEELSFPFLVKENIPNFSGDRGLIGVRNLRCKHYEKIEQIENDIETKIYETFSEASNTKKIVVSVYGANIIVIRGMMIRPYSEKS